MKETTNTGQPPFETIEGGGVTTPRGFYAAGIHAGFKKGSRDLDLALVAADTRCATAGVFTQNTFCAAPVTLCRKHLDGVSYGTAQAIVINAGNANAATGAPGLKTAEDTAKLASSLLDCSPEEVLIASTGVIGVPLSMDLFEHNLGSLTSSAGITGAHNAAKAIMTTDTHSKEYALSYVSRDPSLNGCTIKIGGMVKGSGMIMPDMATMIAVLTTDAPVAPKVLHAALKEAVDVSFNKVTVDSDTSTNDTCILMASGKAASLPVSAFIDSVDSLAYQELRACLKLLCIELARMIAVDGEGATKLITVKVSGAAHAADADRAARSIANSPLVKTAIFGHDANWGRIAMALGKSGAVFKQEDVSIDLLGLSVCKNGLTVPFDEEEALRRFEASEINIDVGLGAGSAEATVWTCDLTHDYVRINGDYRS